MDETLRLVDGMVLNWEVQGSLGLVVRFETKIHVLPYEAPHWISEDHIIEALELTTVERYRHSVEIVAVLHSQPWQNSTEFLHFFFAFLF